MDHLEMSREFWAASCLSSFKQRVRRLQSRVSFLDCQAMYCMGGEL